MDIQEKQRPIEDDVPEMNIGERNARMTAGIWNQVLATVIANMSTLTVGTMLMVAIHYGNVEAGEENQLLMVSFAATILGLFLSFFCSECHGRQVTLCLSAIPLIISCGLVVIDIKYATSAFFLQVIGSSMHLFVLPIYVSEISCDRIRGTLGSMRMIFMTIGFAIAHLMYRYCCIHTAASIIIFFPTILIIGMQWMPESPIFLVRKSLLDDATRSLMRLRNNDQDWVRNELLSIMRTVRRIPNSESGVNDEFKTVVKGLLASSAKRRCFLIASGLLAAPSLCEAMTLVEYKSLNLRQDYDGTNLGALFTFWIFVSPILGSVLSTLLMDSLGRRRSLLISCFGMLLICVINLIFIFGEYTNRYQPFSYVLGFACLISYYLGLGTVPFIIAVEIFEREVLSFGYMMCLIISSSVMFICIWIKLTLYMIVNSSVNPEVLVLSFCCFLFTYVLVPETNGKAIE